MNERAEPLALQDATARAQALDVARSWLVRAPAGSGKTELLIQRFLALLAHVERPESIVATTFTRKAAAEMRDRVIEALLDAQATLAPSPASEHQVRTRSLARAALMRDRALGWRLLEQPSRLRIVTIDALAAALARQAPLAAGLGALPAFVDDAQVLHRDAARFALSSARVDDRHWQTFLAWIDNNADVAVRLVAAMLAARDRWPARLLGEDAATLRREVEDVLEREAQAAIALIVARLPGALAQALPGFARVAAAAFATMPEPAAHAAFVARIAEDGALPASDAREAWVALGEWLLTREGAFRESVTIRHGFPPGASNAQQKADFVRWLRTAEAVPGLADAWHRLRSLPPARFTDEAWAFVGAAMRVLRDAVAALSRVFGERGQADFTEATLRALFALGTDEDPSDLLLAIDYRLQHLLIDEFQDTSRAQLALIERLTAAWAPGDGRTLFVVGDPMQSIYRFRQAEVRLFLEAETRHAIGAIPVGVLDLARNFRSHGALVAWFNDVFAAVLPRVSDTTRGEAAFCASYADPSKPQGARPTLDLVCTRDEEAQRVVARVREAHAAGITDVAILVRARSHAQPVLAAMRQAGIAFSAVDLEGLEERLATRDLMSLARALAQPADRLAWLAVLRAPWCGLRLADLLIVAQESIGLTVVDAIGDPAVTARVSEDASGRLTRLRDALAPALAARGRVEFALRVRAAWLALGGPACASSPLDRDGADHVFALLARHERGGDLPDHEAFTAMASLLFGEPRETQSEAVQVMTLHRAKGLEFDAVILPGLDLETGSGDPPLLRWKVREHDSAPTVVLAPMRARTGPRAETDLVYKWLRELDDAEEHAELGRLLYVGATRARQRLHLTAVATPASDGRDWKRPSRGTALERIWDALADRPPLPDRLPATPTPVVAVSQPHDLVRLATQWRPPPFPVGLPVEAAVTVRGEAPVFDWADAIAAAIGTVAHRLLAQVAGEGLSAWDERRLHAERDRIEVELAGEGVERDLCPRAAQRVATVLARTLADPRGRWLFDAAHADARSEWALAGIDEGRVVHVVVDRSFVANGTRYIVDFKTGEHQGGDRAAFLRAEFDRYHPQLARYARIVGALDPTPIRIALYHPLVDGGWQEHTVDAPITAVK